MRSLLVAALVLTSCGEPETRTRRPQATIDPAANLEVWTFELEWGYQVTGVDLKFASAPQVMGDETSIGVCTKSLWGRTVTLDTDWWMEADADAREALVFHELGHCVLDREHDDTTDELGRPLSVMASEITLVRWAWPHYRQEYVDELFGRETTSSGGE